MRAAIIISCVLAVFAGSAALVGVAVLSKGNLGGSRQPVESVDARTLFNRHVSNQADADRRYNGKIIEVIGERDPRLPIAKNSFGQYVINLRSDVFVDHANMQHPAVQIVFRKSESAKIADLGNAEFVIAHGRCEGQVASMPSFGNFVLITDATVHTDLDPVLKSKADAEAAERNKFIQPPPKKKKAN